MEDVKYILRYILTISVTFGLPRKETVREEVLKTYCHVLSHHAYCFARMPHR